MFKSIELFAGAGGLALGLEQAGFEHIGLVEFDKSAANTLTFNRPQWKVLCEDIAITTQRDLEKEFNIKKGELDLLSGGAPCQSFSYAGKRLGLQDVRGTMFYYYAIFLEKLQPKMFLFENVRGLLTHDKGKTYQTILNIFEEQGYTTNAIHSYYPQGYNRNLAYPRLGFDSFLNIKSPSFFNKYIVIKANTPFKIEYKTALIPFINKISMNRISENVINTSSGIIK